MDHARELTFALERKKLYTYYLFCPEFSCLIACAELDFS